MKTCFGGVSGPRCWATLAPLTINKWCHRAFVRMAMLSVDHPLYKPVNWKRTHVTKRHRGPLQNLTNTYSIDAYKWRKSQQWRAILPRQVSYLSESVFRRTRRARRVRPKMPLKGSRYHSRTDQLRKAKQEQPPY